MGFQVLQDGGAPVKMWLPEGHDIEPQALAQLARTSRLPFVEAMACMPDVHLGMGATIGSVVGTKGAIIPSAVGVDIGCGMMAQRLDLTADQLPDNLYNTRLAIEAAVPHGRTNNGQAGDRGAWEHEPTWLSQIPWDGLVSRYAGILEKHPKMAHKRVPNHMGTLGTGNHFIELCLDDKDRVWIMLHSGSRGPGNKVGTYFISLAKEDMKKHHIVLEDKDLSYLSEGTEWFDDYVEAVSWAQDYAKLNREIMMQNVIAALTRLKGFPQVHLATRGRERKDVAINCHHNYVERENHGGKNLLVTRKGAVRARVGDMGIIPGSMGARSFIVKGAGNKSALQSCSHGAGRVMSRTAARKKFTAEDLVAQTKGVECRKDIEVVDEIPGAYKNIDEVIRVQEEYGMITVEAILKQVVCVKG